MRAAGILAICGLVALSVGAARAQDCAPARLASTLPMRILTPENGLRTVPLMLNGVETQMILDTGGSITQLSRNTLSALGLDTRPARVSVHDINGRTSRRFTVIRQMAFGGLARTNAAFMIWPEPRLPVGGALAQDLLAAHDVEIDFAANQLRLYDRASCPRPGWTRTDAIRLPMTLRNWHLYIPVMVDGRRYAAIFDTGSRRTIMRLPVARRDFGITMDMPGLRTISAINSERNLDGRIHAFQSLSLGSLTLPGQEIMVVPDLMNHNADTSPITRNRAYRHNADLVLPDIIVGMDVLQHLNLYLAYGENALYIAPAQPAPASAIP